MKTWRESFEDLLHAHTDLLLLLESKKLESNRVGEGTYQRRHYDGFFSASKEKLDRIVLNTPKENV